MQRAAAIFAGVAIIAAVVMLTQLKSTSLYFSLSLVTTFLTCVAFVLCLTGTAYLTTHIPKFRGPKWEDGQYAYYFDYWFGIWFAWASVGTELLGAFFMCFVPVFTSSTETLDMDYYTAAKYVGEN